MFTEAIYKSTRSLEKISTTLFTLMLGLLFLPSLKKNKEYIMKKTSVHAMHVFV